MKTFSQKNFKRLIRERLLTACSLFLLMQSFQLVNAQTRLQHYHGVYNRSVDYSSVNSKYVLLGQNAPLSINSMNNTSTAGYYLNRVRLQVLDQSSLGTLVERTYCTQDEVNEYSTCGHLGVEFTDAQARATQDGGYIICGMMRKDVETSCSPGNGYFFDPFLMKVSGSGAVIWCKRYHNNSLFFNSVVEDPVTGNFLVCGLSGFGSNTSLAFTMAVDPMGIPFSNGLNIIPMGITVPNSPYFVQSQSYYTRINTFVSGGNTYFVAVGNLGGTGSTTDLLYSVINNMGNPVSPFSTNMIEPSNGYITGEDVVDAQDGTVAITGLSLGWDALTYKLDPLNPTTPPPGVPVYMNYYHQSTSGNDLLAHGITYNSVTGDFYITGEEYKAATFMLDLNYGGGISAFDAYNSYVDAWIGRSLTFNTSNNDVLISGDAYNMETFATRAITITPCASNPTITVGQLTPVQITSISTIQSTPIDISENIVAYEVLPDENLDCGLKMGTTSIVEVNNKQLTLKPNPAEDFIDIQLPDGIGNGNLNVIDMLGQVVIAQHKVNSKQTRLDISHLTNGVYILSIESEGVKQQARFVKQ